MVSLVLSKDRLLCSICLDVFQNPVSLSCGHNFCQTCINSHWFKVTWRYRCPLCRTEFATRPYPEKNALLGDIAEEFLKAQERAVPPPLLLSDVPCDWCPATAQRKALKSCMRCLASFCQDHLQPHLREEGAFADHPLEEPLIDLFARKCPAHGRLLELYCRRERCFLCAMCAFGDHAEHGPVQLDEEARGRKVDLAVIQKEEKRRLKEADRNREEVRKYMEDVKESESLKADTGPLLSPLLKVDSVSRMRCVDRMLSQLLNGIEKMLENSFARELLQNCAVLGKVEPNILDADEDTASDSLLRLYNRAFKDVQKHLVSITLDSKTAHEYLQIADGNKIVSNISPACVSYHNLPERFEAKGQVMCTERFYKGQFYWEVKFSNPKVGIGLTYGSIIRKGVTRNCFIGKNGSSWCLVVDGKTCRAWHNGVCVVAGIMKSSVLGVFLDYSAGLLDFYSIQKGSLTLVHRFQASFEEPVHPAFWIGQRAALMLCH
uniref:Tripartite motif-containing protein 16-like isoform X2 n=1 Tax=Geotrypetes seraphini TaxID=260995 RepID=A0A6P8SBI9_GEOSA|nr:tripartite motif-containing protein 16-like isoform X2 [Geotrypetes seraphini]